MTFCITPAQITGTSVGYVYPQFGPAFEERIQMHDLVDKARAFNGNLGYHMYRNIQNPEEYRFVETWQDMEALNAWLAGPTVKATFLEDKVVQAMLVGGKLTVQGGYNEVVPIHPPFSHGAVHFSVGASCDKVWGTISDWSDCSWIAGCKHAVVDKNDPNKRVMHMTNDQRITDVQNELDAVEMSLVHTVMDSATGHKAEIDLSKTDGNHCDIDYSFESGGLEADYNDYYKNRIPALQKKWAN